VADDRNYLRQGRSAGRGDAGGSGDLPRRNGRIAFASNRTTATNPEGDFEIFTMHADGSELKQITENAAFDFDPGWT